MAHDEYNRRASDDDAAFKYNIVAQQSEIKTKVELLHDMVKLELASHNKRLEKLEEAVIGSTSKAGLLEQNRNLGRDLAKLFGVGSISILILWKIVSPIYDAWVNRWIPQKIASASEPAENKPSKLIHKTVTVNPVDSQIKKQ